MSCTDQITGERSEEPLETLREFREHGVDVFFAVNAIAQDDDDDAPIRVGDKVTVITKGEPIWGDAAAPE